MKKLLTALLASSLLLSPALYSCSKEKPDTARENEKQTVSEIENKFGNTESIVLADGKVTVNGVDAVYGNDTGVYTANDIVYYPQGKDFTFGEGTEDDAHSEEEAANHTVVHITKPGEYVLSGKLSYGQIAIDLGEDAKADENAKVTLILNGVDINCDVAPAVIFYNVYECGNKDEESASKDVDTGNAGANVIIADGTVNNIDGSYVARIYKSVELNEEGTEVVDSKKLHKYDAAFYSKMTMNVNGEDSGDGILNIKADNEGLDSELHLTINGGIINIESGNDGINTNEDYVSVTTLNGGSLNIVVNGSTGEGDGIDSNGWLVINGGNLTSSACGFSGDAGIDSDMGIHINGGEIVATGNMLDRISESTATYAVFNFATREKGGTSYTLKNEAGESVGEYTPANDFSYMIISSEKLVPGTYTLWCGDKQLAVSATGAMGGFGGGRHGGMGGRPGDVPDFPEGGQAQRPDGERTEMPDFPEGEMPVRPEGGRPQRPQGDMPQGERPEDFDGEMPESSRPEGFPEDRTQSGRGQSFGDNTEASTDIVITEGSNYFNVISEYTA